MHPEALKAMTGMVDRFAQGRTAVRPYQVLDVGSLDVNGTYRPLIEGRGWSYCGLDIRRGPNVDVVAADPYRYPIAEGRYDLVMAGGTMEHVEAIWLWVPELVRVCRPGGMVGIVTHWSFVEHRWPDLGILDYWRILPDGLRALFEAAGSLERIQAEIVSAYDTAGSAWKAAGSLHV